MESKVKFSLTALISAEIFGIFGRPLDFHLLTYGMTNLAALQAAIVDLPSSFCSPLFAN